MFKSRHLEFLGSIGYEEDGLESPRRGESVLDNWNPHRVTAGEKRRAESLRRTAEEMTARQKQAAEAARQPKPKFLPAKPLYCVACGTEIHHAGETAEQWCKIRRCTECRQARCSSGETRYCRICGTPHTMQSAGSNKAGWSTWATCTSCKGGVS